MSMTNPDSIPTKEQLHEMYERIYPYLGGGGSGGSGGHTIEDSTGTALTQRDVMQFSDSFAPTDDSTNEVTKIGLNKLTSGEMDDIVTPLPSVQSRYHEYSTEEQIVGKWIDGSYIYEITKETTSSTPIDVSALNIDTLVSISGLLYTNSEQIPFGFSDAENFIVSGRYSSSQIVFSINRFSNWNKIIFTIQYTKSSS